LVILENDAALAESLVEPIKPLAACVPAEDCQFTVVVLPTISALSTIILLLDLTVAVDVKVPVEVTLPNPKDKILLPEGLLIAIPPALPKIVDAFPDPARKKNSSFFSLKMLLADTSLVVAYEIKMLLSPAESLALNM